MVAPMDNVAMGVMVEQPMTADVADLDLRRATLQVEQKVCLECARETVRACVCAKASERDRSAATDMPEEHLARPCV
jgi:hypothetical protein